MVEDIVADRASSGTIKDNLFICRQVPGPLSDLLRIMPFGII